ncbi:PIF1-like helicase family protein [Leishmania donovani]|uniref:ATP-dependent DNA helicase n=1 Tax=Leishmania donovani TaxID=5661 RepID=A0A504X072_LEIDO|nr:PIF1-like helicase family protein [Leishmania donovani]
MDARASMRAILESARQSIRNRAANPTGKTVLKKGRTLEDSASSSRHPQPTVQPTPSSPALDVAEGLHFQKDTASDADAATAEATALHAKENQMRFVRHYHRLLLAFIEDKSKYELELPNLSSLDRMVVHALAEKCNLSHESTGDRADRVMHLKKDILFFQNPEAAKQVNLDDIIERVSWKESKFQIRYVRSANPAQVAIGDIGSYADEDALEKIERFRRATDEYRHATDMGYTQQELLLAEAGIKGEGADAADGEGYAVSGRLEEILSRPDTSSTPAITTGPVPAVTSSPPPPLSSSTSTIAAAMARSKATAAANAAKEAATATTIYYDEVCRTCGSRARLGGSPQGWRCSHYCAHCTRQSIWCLEEVPIKGEPAKHHKRRRDRASSAEDGGESGRRRRGEPAVEEIDREEGEDDDAVRHSGSRSRGSSGEEDADEALTSEDVVEMAATNDFSAKDMNWLREFASRGTAHVADQIAFCIDFGDLTEARVFRRYGGAAAPSEDACWYVVLREVRELSLTVSDLVRELLNETFVDLSSAAAQDGDERTTSAPAVEAIHTEEAEERAMDHLGIAFPNLSVYGTDCVAVCQLRPAVRWASVPRLPIREEALHHLRQRYGARHVFPTQSLEEAVRRAADAVRFLSLRLSEGEDEQQQFTVSFHVGAGRSSGAVGSFVDEALRGGTAAPAPHFFKEEDTVTADNRRGATASAKSQTAGNAASGASGSGSDGNSESCRLKLSDASVAVMEANAGAAGTREAPSAGAPCFPVPLPRVQLPMEFAPLQKEPTFRASLCAQHGTCGGFHATPAAAAAPSTSAGSDAVSPSITPTTATHEIYSGLFRESFVNPFNGRLVRTTSSAAKMLFGVGFYRGVSNPLQIEWSPAEYMVALQKIMSTQQRNAARRRERQAQQALRGAKAAAAAKRGSSASATKKARADGSRARSSAKCRVSEAAPMPAAEAVAQARSQLLRPFLRRGPDHWTASVATLLERHDAFTYMNKELGQLYARLRGAYMPPKLDTPADPCTMGMTLTPDQHHVVKLALRGFNLFIGGSAGTGKTVLLKCIYRELCQMGLRVAMTATTGVAAVQLGGCTFHHAFNAPLLDTAPHRWDANALRAVDAVIIDEVSLLDACMLDAFDMEARLARMHHRPFGGLQLIVCGDFLQLSREDTLPAYESAAFKHLVALRLVTPMRHAADDPLMKLLEDLRRGRFDAERFAALDRPIPPNTTHITYLFPRRREAQQLNDLKLGELMTQEMIFTPQRGPLQLCGSFTHSALVELNRDANGMRAAMPNRERLLEMIHEEAQRLRAGLHRKDGGGREPVPSVADHELVLMPVRAEGALETRFILRLRCRERELHKPKTRDGGDDDADSGDDGASTRSSSLAADGAPALMAGRTHSSTLAAVAAETLRKPVISLATKRTRRATAPFSATEWEGIATAVATRLGGRIVTMLEEEPSSMVPLSVTMTLADMTSSDVALSLTPLRLKLGCRVMVNRNLSRTVSNGSVGVVEAFAPPDVSLFPRRTDRAARVIFQRVCQQRLFAQLPVVRLLGGEVVQIPPISIVLGGTAQSYFYGHEVLTIPLQLGYAFTVHKVQGLTLQGTVVLDCEKFFDCAHLIYVACSRVRKLDQLVVYRVQPNMIIVRRSALEFSDQLQDARNSKERRSRGGF